MFSWTLRGNGSTLSGVRLARWLASGPARPSWGPIASAIVLIIALAGCLAIGTCAIDHRLVVVARAAVGAVVLAGLLFLAITARLSFDRWGAAAWCALAGALALGASTVFSLSHLTDRSTS
jgi:hypothetical protein